MTLCIVGLGYIGLPTATMFASHGVTVVGVDISQKAIDMINQGKAHIIEPDLDQAVKEAVASGRLKAQLTPETCDYYIICVPTPFKEQPGIPDPDISYVLDAAEKIAPFLTEGAVIIIESTSPVGTTETVDQLLKEKGVTVNYHLAYCPERVLPGQILRELINNDRVVGGMTPEGAAKAAELYRKFVKAKIVETTAKTAEMCKLVENSFRDVNIAFANELSMICAKEDVNVWELIALANLHPRVNILQPGCGVGGHCIAVDPWFIVARDPENAKLIHQARKVNDYKAEWVIERVDKAVQKFVDKNDREPKIACLGLAFKPDIDDLRESPALHITAALVGKSYDVLAVEPHVPSHGALRLVSLEEALESADIFVALVKHTAFKGVNVGDRLMLDFCGLSN
ncbi:MAG: UDP-N-acetyl-D-mannosamine dehydrogenase [Fimbriimonadaceae bacterium]